MGHDTDKAITSYDIGCYVDGSATSSDHLNRRIVQFAWDHGFNPSEDARLAMARFTRDWSCEDSEVMQEESEEAVDYLNEHCSRYGRAWTVEDNSLFYLEIQE